MTKTSIKTIEKGILPTFFVRWLIELRYWFRICAIYLDYHIKYQIKLRDILTQKYKK